MTIFDAIEEVKAGILPGIRGVGCAAIVMADGKRYGVVSAYGPLILIDNQTGRQLTAGDVVGEVEGVEWSVDQLGGVIG